MNRTALVTVGKKLTGNDLYLLSVFDLEPSGIIIQAYNQIDSKEYMLPISEQEVRDIPTETTISMILSALSRWISTLFGARHLSTCNQDCFIDFYQLFITEICMFGVDGEGWGHSKY